MHPSSEDKKDDCLQENPFQNELPAEGHMLLRSGQLLCKVPMGRKNTHWGPESKPQFVLELLKIIFLGKYQTSNPEMFLKLSLNNIKL
jgi:hypothetical protein